MSAATKPHEVIGRMLRLPRALRVAELRRDIAREYPDAPRDAVAMQAVSRLSQNVERMERAIREAYYRAATRNALDDARRHYRAANVLRAWTARAVSR